MMWWLTMAVATAAPYGAVHLTESSGDGTRGVPVRLGGGGSVGWALSPALWVEGMAELSAPPAGGGVRASVRPQARLVVGPEGRPRVGLVAGAGYGYDAGHGVLGAAGLSLELPSPGRLSPRLQAMYSGGTVGDAVLGVSAHLVVGPRPEPEPEPVVVEPQPEPPPLDLSDAASMVWMPKPTCEWLPVDEARPMLQGMVARPALAVLDDPWFEPDAVATPAPAASPAPAAAPEPASSEPRAVPRPRPTVGDLVVVALPGDEVWVDGEPVAVAPSGLASVRLDEGRADVRVVGAGRDTALPVAVGGGATVWLQVDDEPPLEHFVRFAQGRDRLVPEAEATVVALGSALGAWRMEVRGGYSPEGSLAANEALAQQRAEAVRAALLAAGVPDERIVVVPPAPPDPDHTVDEQRAVHLRLLPAETMP